MAENAGQFQKGVSGNQGFKFHSYRLDRLLHSE